MPGSLTPENCFQGGLREKLLQEAKLSTTDAVLREQTSAVKRTMARDTFVDLRRTPTCTQGRSQRLTTERNLVMALVPTDENLKSAPVQELSVPLLKHMPQRKNSDVF